jgi:acyl-homoserine lactone acylase PvdQ
MIKKFLGYLIFLTTSLVLLSIVALFYLYRPITTGTIYLKNARGTAEILRETENSFPHVFADSEMMALFSQGFLHAQERLW